MKDGTEQPRIYVKNGGRIPIDVDFASKDINRLVGNIKLTLMRRSEIQVVTVELKSHMRVKLGHRPAQPDPSFLGNICDQLLRLLPLRYLERAYEPSKWDAEANRVERFEKEGNVLAANHEYRREMRKVVLFTFLTLPIFLMGEVLAQVRRMVSR